MVDSGTEIQGLLVAFITLIGLILLWAGTSNPDKNNYKRKMPFKKLKDLKKILSRSEISKLEYLIEQHNINEVYINVRINNMKALISFLDINFLEYNIQELVNNHYRVKVMKNDFYNS